MGSKSLKKVASFALPIAGATIGSVVPGVGTALGATLGGAASGAVQGNGLKGIALGAATGYAGNAIGNSISSTLAKGLGSAGSTSIGSITSKNAMGPFSFGDLGGTAANSIGNTLANTTVATGLGKFAGNSIADNLASSFMPQEAQMAEMPAPAQEPQGFEPKQEAQLTLPNSLSGLSSFDPNQQSTNIATQGVYGGGAGPQEQDYFTNLINRRLVDESGQVDSDLSEINPIETSYLSQLGFGGYDNPSSLLEALYGRKQAQIPA